MPRRQVAKRRSIFIAAAVRGKRMRPDFWWTASDWYPISTLWDQPAGVAGRSSEHNLNASNRIPSYGVIIEGILTVGHDPELTPVRFGSIG
jgi:hypothetical protein